MSAVPSARRALAATAGVLLLAFSAVGQDAELTISEPVLRPNSKVAFKVFVTNKSKLDKETFQVRLEGLPGTNLKATGTVSAVKTAGTAVKFTVDAPPAAKKEEPKKEEPKAEPKKDAEPLPAGAPLVGVPIALTDLGGNNGQGYGFIVKVLDKNGQPLEPAVQQTVKITVQRPTVYVKEPSVSLEGDIKRGLRAVVTAEPAKKGGVNQPVQDLDPPAEVTLDFPTQLGLKVTDLRAGSYKRKLFKTEQVIELNSTDLPYTGKAETIKFSIGVDGFARAFTYTLNASKTVSSNREQNLIPSDPKLVPAIRIYPVGASAKAVGLAPVITTGALKDPRYPTLPSSDLRFRIEVDNEPTNATLEFRIDRSTKRDFADPDEKVALGLPRDYKVALDLGGPDEALIVSNSVTDHIKGIDVSALRGEHELQAVLKIPGVEEAKLPRAYLRLIVDETPPSAESIDFRDFPKRHVRGTPLPVVVTVSDSETNIDKVVVYAAKAGPDGKFPDDAPKAIAVKNESGSWVAQLPLIAAANQAKDPKDPKSKGPVNMDVTAVATNEVELSQVKVIKIELVDPKLATIKAKIERGGRPQPMTQVTLRDAEGKDKGTAKTDAKGIATFEGLTPGVYRLRASKEDSSTGLAGNGSVTVPDPPDPKAIETTIDLVKRR